MLGGGGFFKPSNFTSVQSMQQMTMDNRKLAILEEKLHQLDEKFNAFQTKSQNMSMASMTKKEKENSLAKDNVN